MLDWRLYQNQFSTPDMRQIWSETATISGWLETEQVIANCQAEMGIVPPEVAALLAEISFSDIDIERLAVDMAIAGRPIVGLVKQLRLKVGEPHGRYVHFQTTTQDIMDTTMVLQMRAGLVEIDKSLDSILCLLKTIARKHGDVQMIGRTNGQYAVPMRFGLKVELWIAELRRRREAITTASDRGLMVQFGGSVGDLSTYEYQVGNNLKQAIANQLGLKTIEPHWQNARDGVAEIVSSIGLLCSSLCKIAQNINLLSSSDLGELAETPEDGKGASSSMNHKRNQRCSEFAEAVARLGRQRSEQINEVTLHQHERSGGVWIAEWIIIPDVFLLTSGALMWIEDLFSNLEVNTNQMKVNLERHIEKLSVQFKI